jgi:hypothetical protein
MEQGTLQGVRVIEDGRAIGINVAGLLLAELGASVTRIGSPPDLTGPGRIVHRAKTTVAPGEPLPAADVMLLGRESQLPATAPVVVRFPDPPAEDLGGLAPAGTMLAEARSGLMRLQLGHRDGPFCLASPIAGLGAGILGALSLMGRPDLAEDRELDAALPFNIADQAQGEALAALVAEFVAGLSVDECVDLCVRNKIVAAPVLNGPAFLAHPQAAANGLPAEVNDTLGRQLQVGRFVQCTATEADASPLGALDDVAAGPAARRPRDRRVPGRGRADLRPGAGRSRRRGGPGGEPGRRAQPPGRADVRRQQPQQAVARARPDQAGGSGRAGPDYGTV